MESLDLLEKMLQEMISLWYDFYSYFVISQDVGVHLKDKISAYCKKAGLDCSVKYIDPTYMIRSVPANAHDKLICT
jgi:hypothetical protein